MKISHLAKASLASSAALLLAFAGAPQLSAQPSGSDRPNILLIVLDDLGTEKLSFYGQSASHPPTPRLAELRGRGILFTNAYANPVCATTRAMLQTGRFSFRTGMGTNPLDALTLNSQEVTLAEMLKAGFWAGPTGYRCGAFGKWHLTRTGTPDREHVCANGYDRFVGPIANNSNHFAWRRITDTPTTTAIDEPIGHAQIGPFDTTTYDASVACDAAVEWIAEQSSPFFAYVAFNPPHAPLQVPPFELLSAATVAEIEDEEEKYEPGDIVLPSDEDDALAYGWMIEAVDSEIGRLLDRIPEEKLKRTTIFVIGDNGTHASVAREPLAPDHAKGTVYQGGTRVPLLVTGRGIAATSATCHGLVSAVDLWATFAALTNAQVGETFPGGDCGDGVIDGVSFHHMLANPAASSLRETALVQLYAPVGCFEPAPFVPADKSTHDRGMTDGRFKYVRSWNDVTSVYDEEAYDLAADAYEELDLFPILLSLPQADRETILALRDAIIELSGN